MSLNRNFIGDSCICWSFGDEINESLSIKVLSTFQALNTPETRDRFQILDFVPSYNALAIHFDFSSSDISPIIEAIEAIIVQTTNRLESPDTQPINVTTHVIPVVYSGDDL